MIKLTRRNGALFMLNAECIREIEATPDTIVTLSNGEKYMVKETVDEVGDAVIRYKRKIHGADPM